MSDVSTRTAPRAELSAWASQPYGAPTASSEVSTIPDFYTVAAQTIFHAERREPAESETALPLAA